MRSVIVVAVLAAAFCCCPASAAPRPGFGWPLAGSVVVERGFDPPRTPYGPGHRGVDLRAGVDQQVRAAGPGRVTYAGLLAGRGVVTVTHAGGLRTSYEPVSPEVGVGTSVVKGSILGRVTRGHASCRGTSCLHWGLLRGRVYLNPLSLVQAGELRLLPLASRPGRPLTGSLWVQPQVQPQASMRTPERAEQRSGAGVQGAAVAAFGGLLLGWTAWRRQDARGRPPVSGGGP